MATIATFKCSKCGKEFSLKAGLLQKDLTNVTGGEELPGEGKLPDQKTFEKISKEETTKNAFDFTNALMDHQKTCKGEVKLVAVVFAH
jgi:hypothetical protein